MNKPDCSCPPIENPTAEGTVVCTGTAANLTATGCATGTTAKWYSNINLTTEVGSGCFISNPQP
ncbi:MAG: hypothetical protein R2822_19395 [Spirosomataceae bacterium]